ncbi:uncharacterized protein LAJ45_06906 [Morchella importuna]|uniref:uncharacterized protein n=1 Tax=Morchella importuna TaxID=1174673 RepID=UPI001E8E9B1A|nr:uncharacterized protein LAJ45_06906 [Morchella importuna]KAH8148932.1 hypothetical protein LAJ45_06906 [Morchella importuna]
MPTTPGTSATVLPPPPRPRAPLPASQTKKYATRLETTRYSNSSRRNFTKKLATALQRRLVCASARRRHVTQRDGRSLVMLSAKWGREDALRWIPRGRGYWEEQGKERLQEWDLDALGNERRQIGGGCYQEQGDRKTEVGLDGWTGGRRCGSGLERQLFITTSKRLKQLETMS